MKKKKTGKVEKVMHEFKHGKLHSGSKNGPMVSDKKQAMAIAMSEAKKAYPHGSGPFSDKDLSQGYKTVETIQHPKDIGDKGPGSTVELQEIKGDKFKSGEAIGRAEPMIPAPGSTVQSL